MVLNEFDPREEPGRDPQEQVSGKLINFTVLRTSQYLAFLALWPTLFTEIGGCN